MKKSSRSAEESASAIPESTNASIAPTSPEIRDIVSPSRRESKNAGESVWRCENRRTRTSSTKRSPTQVESTSSANVTSPPTSATATNSPATHGSAARSFGTRTSSISSLKTQTAAASRTAAMAIRSRVTASHGRYGRAYGQNRRMISRTGTGGAWVTSPSASKAGANRAHARRRAFIEGIRRRRPGLGSDPGGTAAELAVGLARGLAGGGLGLLGAL